MSLRLKTSTVKSSAILAALLVCVIAACWSLQWRERQIQAYEDGASIARLASALSYGLIKNHAFIDGNKRVGYAALVVFLDLNGYRLVDAEWHRVTMTQRAAAGEITEAEWQSWIERSMQVR